MKYILLGLLLLPSLIQAQLITSNGKIIAFDTIAIIDLVPIQDTSIRIVDSKYRIYFDKSDLLHSLTNQHAELDPYNEWRTYIERVSKYIGKKKILEINNYLIKEPKEILRLSEQNDEQLTESLLWELACPLLESGRFKLIIDSDEVQQVLIVSADFESGLGAKTLLSTKGEPFWICPPLTID